MRYVYILNTKYLRIYFRGSYSWLEINIGSKKELVIHLINKNGLINCYVNDFSNIAI